MKSALRSIPAVEKILQALGETDLPRPAVVAVVRRELAALRAAKTVPDFDGVVSRIRASLFALRACRLQPLINGTGILAHTNFGRSPLGAPAVQKLAAIGAQYNNLEYDLISGARGKRGAYLEHNLALLCGAEAATVVNNNAAALVLILRHFTAAERKEVVISRGELVQIGGGFRIPDILEASGAKLREVGTTNKTSVGDYARVIGRQTALLLKVHRSNFFMGGFVQSAAPEDLAALAKKKRVPFVEDLGSGAVMETRQFAGLEHEPTPAEVLRRGAKLVCFSGDKLLGGPQAGIIAGSARLIAALKRDQFYRALRCDKLIFAALEATVDAWLRAENTIPIQEMLRADNAELRRRAQKLKESLASLPVRVGVGAARSQMGGGTLPRSIIESVALELSPQTMSVDDFAARLRTGAVPVVGYIERGQLKLDLRTVFAHQDEALLAAIHAALTPASPPGARAAQSRVE
jgi:L-seryl-tRNA(Ser) seleniumtransferase